MNEFLEQFVVEARELCGQGTADLLALETSPSDKDRIDAAFRAFHTLKGGAGIVGFDAMARAVHAAEDALSAVRSNELQITSSLIGDCLFCIDQVIQWLDQIEVSGEVPDADGAADTIVARIGAARPEAARAGQQPAGPDRSFDAAAREILEEQLRLLDDPNPPGTEGRLVSAARVTANVFRESGLSSEATSISAGVLANKDSLSNAIRLALRAADAHEKGAGAVSKADTRARVLRVDADRIDNLVRLTGEIIVAKNAIYHVTRQAEEFGDRLANPLRQEYQRLERLTVQLQNAVLSLRVLPIRDVFQRFSRIIRELAVDLKKPASLVTEGDDTEADKAIVEMLFEPLLHIVRNAMDHGIESSEERAALGKPVVATVKLSASRDGEHITLEISDDGAGVDLERVKQVALERGIVAADTLGGMNDDEVTDLIFAPGFTTATAVTNLSGRGVGMDAVRSAVAHIGGHVGIRSQRGAGTIVWLTLPFSIMMTRVMTVEAGGQMFGIPLDAVVETARVSRDRIQAIGEIAAFTFRDQTLPLISLATTLGQNPKSTSADHATVVIARLGPELGGLEIDRVGERMDVMLKPVAGLLASTPGLAGTTLMGDGRVLLILDLASLVG